MPRSRPSSNVQADLGGCAATADLRGDLQGYKKEANAGISAAMAMAGMPQATNPNENLVSNGAPPSRRQRPGHRRLARYRKRAFRAQDERLPPAARGSRGVALGAGMRF